MPYAQKSVSKRTRIMFPIIITIVVSAVVPQATAQKHIYIAFRISEQYGLLPANNMQGRPVVLELAKDVEPISPTAVADAVAATKGKVAYRKPVTVIAKVMDGQKVLIQTRIPVYQLGKILSFPTETLMR